MTVFFSVFILFDFLFLFVCFALNPFMYWWDCSLSFKNCLTNTNNVDLQNKSDTLTWQAAMEIFSWVYECPVMCRTQKLQEESHFVRTNFKWLLTETTDGIIQIVKDVGTVSAFSYNWIHQFQGPEKCQIKIRTTVLWGIPKRSFLAPSLPIFDSVSFSHPKHPKNTFNQKQRTRVNMHYTHYTLLWPNNLFSNKKFKKHLVIQTKAIIWWNPFH